MSIFEEYRGFWGTGHELSERAKKLSKTIGINAEKVTERLIRYYTSAGVLDKPDRLGREAAYHFKHLLQLITARRLVDEGVSLMAISKFNLNKSAEELEQSLLNPSKVEALTVSTQYLEVKNSSKVAESKRKDTTTPEDAFSGLRELTNAIQKEVLELSKRRDQLEMMVTRLEEKEEQIFKEFQNERREMKHMYMEIMEQLTRTSERQNRALEDQLCKMSKQVSSMQEEVLMLLHKQVEHKFPTK